MNVYITFKDIELEAEVDQNNEITAVYYKSCNVIDIIEKLGDLRELEKLALEKAKDEYEDLRYQRQREDL
jgi:hypothetical protein